MAKTTFSGPIRSENNVQLISKTASTGVVHDRTQCFGLHDARRYYPVSYTHLTLPTNREV